jgi:hypothetical protein
MSARTLVMSFEQFLFQVAAAMIGASVGAWIAGYAGEKGRRKVLREELGDILRETQQKAYEEEKGKRLATHEDIENVLRELRLVTSEAESIKTKLLGGEWDRQVRWNRRVDLYGRLLECCEELRTRLVTVSLIAETDDNVEPPNQPFEQAVDQLVEQINDFMRVRAVVLLFSNELVHEVTDQITIAIQKTAGDEPDYYAAIQDLEKLIPRLVGEMRMHLGVEPMNQTVSQRE